MNIVYNEYTQYHPKEVHALQIIVSNTSNKPIYEQVYAQIKSQILTGVLKEGEALPSMRALAKDLRISVITTKRAYEELERDGFIISQTGKGSFVAQKNLQIVKEEHLKQIEMHIQEIKNLSTMCDLSIDDVIEMFQTIYEEE